MKRVLIDSENTIIYEGVDAKKIFELMKADPADVTEEDEVMYEKELRELTWKGDLRYEVHFNLKFRGIDDFNRPVFKDVDSTLHFGSTNHLVGYDKTKEYVIEFFKHNPSELEYFGDKFNCEPEGGKQSFFKFNFIE